MSSGPWWPERPGVTTTDGHCAFKPRQGGEKVPPTFRAQSIYLETARAGLQAPFPRLLAYRLYADLRRLGVGPVAGAGLSADAGTRSNPGPFHGLSIYRFPSTPLQAPAPQAPGQLPAAPPQLSASLGP